MIVVPVRGGLRTLLSDETQSPLIPISGGKRDVPRPVEALVQ
jgi:hypothetical protein